jgi:hypothetical protein
MSMNQPGYETLAAVLQAAYDQAATGKGKERHANDLPFDQQPMQQIARRRGIGFVLGQADKKSEEAQGMLERGDFKAFRHEILGAINYLAGAIVFAESERSDRVDDNESQEFVGIFRDGHAWQPLRQGTPPMPGRTVEFKGVGNNTETYYPYRVGDESAAATHWRYAAVAGDRPSGIAYV